eukprot:1161120-Pelagomonas_calceolata.AAC.1
MAALAGIPVPKRTIAAALIALSGTCLISLDDTPTAAISSSSLGACMITPTVAASQGCHFLGCVHDHAHGCYFLRLPLSWVCGCGAHCHHFKLLPMCMNDAQASIWLDKQHLPSKPGCRTMKNCGCRLKLLPWWCMCDEQASAWAAGPSVQRSPCTPGVIGGVPGERQIVVLHVQYWSAKSGKWRMARMAVAPDAMGWTPNFLATSKVVSGGLTIGFRRITMGSSSRAGCT